MGQSQEKRNADEEGDVHTYTYTHVHTYINIFADGAIPGEKKWRRGGRNSKRSHEERGLRRGEILQRQEQQLGTGLRDGGQNLAKVYMCVRMLMYMYVFIRFDGGQNLYQCMCVCVCMCICIYSWW